MTIDAAPASAGHRRERRSIPPYGDGTNPNAVSNLLDNILAKSRFAPFGNVATLEQATYHLSQEEASRAVQPRFDIVLNQVGELYERLGIDEDELEVGLSARCNYLRRYEVLERWRMDSVPSDPWSPDQTRLRQLHYSGRGVDFILAVRVTANRDELITQGFDAGKVLCRKVFSVKEAVETFAFPFQWVQFGGDTGQPAEALWVIDWKESEEDVHRFERPVEEVLTVLVNREAEAPLRLMAEVSGANDLGWRMLAADIITQIWADVLGNTAVEPDEADTETLVGQVFARLSRESGLAYPQIKELAQQNDSLTELRSLVATILRVVGR